MIFFLFFSFHFFFLSPFNAIFCYKFWFPENQPEISTKLLTPRCNLYKLASYSVNLMEYSSGDYKVPGSIFVGTFVEMDCQEVK